jgi:hypothetical protein
MYEQMMSTRDSAGKLNSLLRRSMSWLSGALVMRAGPVHCAAQLASFMAPRYKLTWPYSLPLRRCHCDPGASLYAFVCRKLRFEPISATKLLERSICMRRDALLEA